MTLVLGPPGSGKSLLLKTLAGRISKPDIPFLSKMGYDGEVTYNGETEKSGNFLLPKFIDYVEQGDNHASVSMSNIVLIDCASYHSVLVYWLDNINENMLY